MLAMDGGANARRLFTPESDPACLHLITPCLSCWTQHCCCFYLLVTGAGGGNDILKKLAHLQVVANIQRGNVKDAFGRSMK
jgi:hypothetical protein